MDRLLRRERNLFNGFTTSEIEKMEKVLEESGKKSLDEELFKRLARGFNRAKSRAGKPILKWTEVQSWFQNRQQDQPSKGDSPTDPVKLAVLNKNQSHQMSKDAGENVPDLSELEFEARSKDGAWYDVEKFLTHRILSSGETEVRVRYAGFGSDEDEWVNVKRNVRLRSLPFEHSECGKIKVGDLVVCFQERNEEARYYDAHVVAVQRKLHDIRGCRCLFLIRYDHDNTEESVRLRRLCRQPTD